MFGSFAIKGVRHTAGINYNVGNCTAILSTSVMPKDGIYVIRTVAREKVDMKGIPHYIGHPCTKKIVEDMGAKPSKSRTFRGLQIGEMAICVPIKHSKNHREHKFTRANQIVTINDLCFRILKRVG